MGSNQPPERFPPDLPPPATQRGARNDAAPVLPYSARWATGSRLTAMAIVLLLIAAALAKRSFRAPAAELAGAGVASISTGANERREVRLGDDAVVTLAADSRIRYAVTKTRTEVELLGAAEFKVDHSLFREFDVRARNAQVLDLGTEFIVRAYYDDSAVIAAVHSGIVAVADIHHQAQPERLGSGAVRLGAGQLVSVFPDGRIGTPLRYTVAQYSSLLHHRAGTGNPIVRQTHPPPAP